MHNKEDLLRSAKFIDGDPKILPASRIDNQIHGRPTHAMGQIKRGSVFGEEIFKMASNTDYMDFLEIGPCCGIGTTKCLLDGLMLREDNSRLISIESNIHYYEITRRYWERYFAEYGIPTEKLALHYGSTVSFDELDAKKDTGSQAVTKETYDYNIDIRNAPLLTIEDNVDVLCLDGGLYSTEVEWRKFKDRIDAVILDDTNSGKTKDILAEIQQSDQWENIYINSSGKGQLIAKRIR